MRFSVDSALLRELGERLVGKPAVALAELVKNSYDADAPEVIVEVRPDQDRITVWDRGHGMTLGQFERFWMRIGTSHKQDERVSPRYGRPMTGSKGVGRLSAQFLAHQLRIRTIPRPPSDEPGIEAWVDWDAAASKGNLTEAEVEYRELREDLGIGECGTFIELQGLKQTWTGEDITSLAAELWWIQPPFDALAPANQAERASEPSIAPADPGMQVLFESNEDEARVFDARMRAILDIWLARLVGRNDEGRVQVSLQFAGEAPMVQQFRLEDNSNAAAHALHAGEFDIRVYGLKRRQPRGIKVAIAREYMNRWGGIHVYDTGFRLPFYGEPQNDWLHIEQDHSHRLTLSKLLPKEMMVAGGLSFLPTTSRLLGAVRVNTGLEREAHARSQGKPQDGLQIQITRDRLVANQAHDELTRMVRWALDWYANEEARREFTKKDASRPTERTDLVVERLEQVFDRFAARIPEDIRDELAERLTAVSAAVDEERLVQTRDAGLLAALATAGMASVAYGHELTKLLAALDDAVRHLQGLEAGGAGPEAQEAITRLQAISKRARALGSLFGFVADEDMRSQRRRYRARGLLTDLVRQLDFLKPGIEVDLSGLPDDVRLPEATAAEWFSLFQNVFTNAFNALLDSDERRVAAIFRRSGASRAIVVQDTGVGVDLATSQDLFEPFVRHLAITPQRRALGYGGTGLGLTIVRMVARAVGCDVSFTEPDPGFHTAFRLAWKEK